MPQLKQACSVANGSQTVVIVGVDLTSRIKRNSVFMVEGQLTPYTVAANSTLAGSDTLVLLSGDYLGATNAAAAGVFVTDYTFPDMIPTIAQGDVGTAAVFTQAMYRVQELINSVSPGGLTIYAEYVADTLANRNDVATMKTDVTTLKGQATAAASAAATSSSDANISATAAAAALTSVNAGVATATAKASAASASADDAAALLTLTNTAAAAAATSAALSGAKALANNLTAGTAATGPLSVTITGDAPDQTLSLTIPAGAKGDKGDTGDKGDKGDAGQDGLGTVNGVSGTAPIVSTGGNTPAISISPATATDPGSMSAADKAKLDAVASNAQLRDRATHTGAQAISTVTSLQAALDGKESSIAAGTTAQYMRGDKTWRDFAGDTRTTVLTGLSTATNAVITATDTVLAALGKLQKQASDVLASITAHIADMANPHGITKAHVGLGNADDTSDANKPVSTAQQTALDLKASLAGNTFSGAQILSDQQVSRAMFKDCGMVFLDKGNSGTAAQTLDYTTSGHQKITVTGAFTLGTSDWPPTGNLGELLLELVNGAAFAVTWPTINWVKSDGTTTTSFASNGITLQASGTDWVMLWSRNGGTTIYGKVMR